MELRLIKNIELFDEFVKNSPYGHYKKTSMWANISKKYYPIYIGFFENDALIGTALALKHSGINSYLYVPLGMCIDYTNEDVLGKSLELIKKFAQKQNVNFLRIDPNVIRVSRDINGNQTDKINNENITQAFINAGFKHKGYGYAYNGSFSNRYTLIIDLSLDIEQLKNNFAKPRITSLNRHNVIGLYTRYGTCEDIKYIMEFEKELVAIQGFKPHSYDFFKNIIDSFKENSRVYITEVNLDTMIMGIDSELNSKKYQKDLEARKAKEKELDAAKALKKEYGSILTVGAGLFLYYGNKSWDLYTYNKKSCNFLKPIDNLHFFAIKDMKELGVTSYDMCGFSGSTDKNDAYYGLYSYKKSFNPEFIEMIGEFDYVYNESKYKTVLKIKRGINLIRRKIVKTLFKKG